MLELVTEVEVSHAKLLSLCNYPKTGENDSCDTNDTKSPIDIYMMIGQLERELLSPSVIRLLVTRVRCDTEKTL